MLFHGLAFGTAESLSLDHYKSHTTTPSNDANKKRFTAGSRNSLGRMMMSSTFDAKSNSGLAAVKGSGVGETVRELKKP